MRKLLLFGVAIVLAIVVVWMAISRWSGEQPVRRAPPERRLPGPDRPAPRPKRAGRGQEKTRPLSCDAQVNQLFGQRHFGRC
jgi:hypothetical protein